MSIYDDVEYLEELIAAKEAAKRGIIDEMFFIEEPGLEVKEIDTTWIELAIFAIMTNNGKRIERELFEGTKIWWRDLGGELICFEFIAGLWGESEL